MGSLFPQLGIEPPPSFGRQSLSHWAAGEIPMLMFFKMGGERKTKQLNMSVNEMKEKYRIRYYKNILKL